MIEAYGELVDEGCLAVYGPNITDNAEPCKLEIERQFEVPSLSVTGSEVWLGPWTFALPMGSMADEPVFWVEQMIPQTAQDITAQVTKLHADGPDAIVHCGFGFGMAMTNMILETLDWDPPRYMSTAFENAWLNDLLWQAMLGWTGIDQYDEENPVGQSYLDQFEDKYGRRPQYCVPVVNFDAANVLLQAFADAHPLTPQGVREALERVKMIPAAPGSPGTFLSFGHYMHRGWVGAGYLVARQLDPDGINSHRVARFGRPGEG